MVHVVVVGPGALGTLFAVRLHQAGHDVTMACRTAKTAKELAKQGLRLHDDRGTHHVEVPTIHKPRQLDTPSDAVIVATKCAAAQDALQTWGGSGPAIGLQNGLMGDALARTHPAYVPCTVGFPATWDGPGRSIHTATGALYLGPWPEGPMQAHHERAADLLQDVAPVQTHHNMQGVAWSKLLINSVGMVGTLTGLGLGDLLRHRRAKDAFLQIVAEGHEAGLADGMRFEKVAGFHPDMVRRAGRVGGRAGQRALVGIIGRKYRRMRSSSLQSLARGQKTEAMYLNGHITATGQRHGLHTPVNDALLHLIGDLESGRLEPTPALLEQLPL